MKEVILNITKGVQNYIGFTVLSSYILILTSSISDISRIAGIAFWRARIKRTIVTVDLVDDEMLANAVIMR